MTTNIDDYTIIPLTNKRLNVGDIVQVKKYEDIPAVDSVVNFDSCMRKFCEKFFVITDVASVYDVGYEPCEDERDNKGYYELANGDRIDWDYRLAELGDEPLGESEYNFGKVDHFYFQNYMLNEAVFCSPTDKISKVLKELEELEF